MTYRVCTAPGIAVGDVIGDIGHGVTREVTAVTVENDYGEEHGPFVREVVAAVTRLPREQRDRVIYEAQFEGRRVLVFDEDGHELGDSRSSVYGSATLRGDLGILAGLAIASNDVVTLTAADAEAMGLNR